MVDITYTQSTPVAGCADDALPVFSVNSGIPLEHALTELSILLNCAQAAANELCDTQKFDRQLLGAALHCIKGARAVADALLTHDLSTKTL